MTHSLFSSPNPTCHLSYCYHFVSVLIVHDFLTAGCVETKLGRNVKWGSSAKCIHVYVLLSGIQNGCHCRKSGLMCQIIMWAIAYFCSFSGTIWPIITNLCRNEVQMVLKWTHFVAISQTI